MAEMLMKNSRIEWIGEVPNDWKIIKAKYLFQERNEKGNKIELQLLSPTQYYRVIPQKLFQELSTSKPVQVNENADLMSFKTVHKGDFCISLSAYMGGFEYSEYEGVISPAYHSFYKTSMNVVDDYYKHLFKSNRFIDLINTITPQSVRVGRNTSFFDFGNSFIPLPPKNEQTKIADFLDSKCSEIDNLTKDIEHQIETLEEYKKSIITEAVTKGLNPDVEMKDSGIEWVEKIPKRWDTTRIKYLFNSGKGLNITKENLINDGLSVISYGQIHAKNNNKVSLDKSLLRCVSYDYEKLFPESKVDKYDFVFADTSEDYEGCGNCVYKRDDTTVFAGYHSVILKSKYKQDNRYLAYLFVTDAWRKQIREKASGVKIFSITQKNIMNAYVLTPPKKDQEEISDYLDSKCSKIDEMILCKNNQISKLEEYKKSLIYEYVTGKKEVLKNAI